MSDQRTSKERLEEIRKSIEISKALRTNPAWESEVTFLLDYISQLERAAVEPRVKLIADDFKLTFEQLRDLNVKYNGVDLDVCMAALELMEHRASVPPVTALPTSANVLILYPRQLERQGWCSPDNEIWRERAKNGQVELFVRLFDVERYSGSTKSAEGSHG